MLVLTVRKAFGLAMMAYGLKPHVLVGWRFIKLSLMSTRPGAKEVPYCTMLYHLARATAPHACATTPYPRPIRSLTTVPPSHSPSDPLTHPTQSGKLCGACDGVTSDLLGYTGIAGAKAKLDSIPCGTICLRRKKCVQICEDIQLAIGESSQL